MPVQIRTCIKSTVIFIISSIKNIYIYSIIYVHMNIKSYKNKKKIKNIKITAELILA